MADGGQVLDGGQHQVVLGREVVELCPRLTPARCETSVVEVPLQPCSTRHSTVASSSRWRIAGVRSLLRHARRVVDMRSLVPPRKQTVKTDCF